jgi:GH15 family glucan-1,4-alpha-glucosidase
MLRPAGGLAPGARFRDDGDSWTPETALFGYVSAALGDVGTARGRLSWLQAHRTAAGSLPEKVLADGRPASVAPLGWTAALVLLTLTEPGVLDSGVGCR